MKLQPSKEPVRWCQDCELWSPDKHIMTSTRGTCEKYTIIVPRHFNVCEWRRSVPIPDLVLAIEGAYEQFKTRHSRPEFTGRSYEVPTQRAMQTDFNDDLETPN